uniref:Reprolysin n=1 Tax=Rhipicephalus appendiculatus TaxID=34631 RepID=A0A131YYW8_RHIAP
MRASSCVTPHRRGQGRQFLLASMCLALTLVFLCATAEGLEEPRLVYPRLLEERSSEGKLVLRIHDDLILNLERASVAAPQLRVLTEEDGASVTQMYDGHEINRNLYQDRHQLATVELKMRERNAEVTGIVGPHHRIEPVPTMERSESGLIAHMVYEIKHAEVYDKALSFVEKDSRFTARNADAIGSVPEQVNIEVFVVADTVHYSRFKGPREALVYVCIMLNAANLRLTDMTKPMVSLLLTGMEKLLSEDFLIGTSEYLHDSSTIKNFREYGRKMKSAFKDPDILFLLSGRDVVTDGKDGTWDKRGAGIGYVGGVCTSFFVALGEDAPGLFTGVRTVTHEIAHLLGSMHDEDGPSSTVPRHPGAKACPWNDGYIMSYVDNGPNRHRFSKCSIEQMRFVLTVRGKTCWDVVSPSQNLTRKYPGHRNITRRICMKVFPNKENVRAEVINRNGNECKLKCYYSVVVGRFLKTYSTWKDAPDYVSCGKKMVCVRGYCVDAPNFPRKAPGGGRNVTLGTAKVRENQVTQRQTPV